MQASRQNVSLYLTLRLFLLGSVLSSAIILRWNGIFPAHVFEAVTALCAFSFLMTSGFILLRETTENVRYFVPSQVAYDILLTTALTFYSGTNESIYVTFYLINIMFTAVLINGYAALLVAVLCGGLWFMLVFFSSDNFTGERSYLMMTTETSFIVVALLTGQLVDELKRNKARIGRLERVSDEIVDSLDAGLIKVNAKGIVLHMNRTARVILGIPENYDFMNTHVEQAVPGFKGLSDIEDSEVQEIQHNGILRRYLISKVALPDQNSMILFRDLTEILALEERVKTHAHLASVGSLAASLAHEIRNPIASISGAAQMLKETNLASGEVTRLNALIVRETERVDLLVAQLLKFAKSEVVEKESVPIVSLIYECIEGLKARPEFATAKVEIKFDPPPNTIAEMRLPSNKEQMREVFSNLLLNSFQALKDMKNPPDEKIITVNIVQKSKDVEVIVSDNGPGVPQEFRSRIFDPFFTTKSYGTGLGLARVYKIVKDHAGRIDIESNGNQMHGTTLRVRLPLSA